MKLIDTMRRKRYLRKIKKIQSLWRILRNDHENIGYQKKALKELCNIAGGWRRISSESGGMARAYVDIILSDGYEISGSGLWLSDALADAGMSVIKHIMKAAKGREGK